jgi:hypothetical protein
MWKTVRKDCQRAIFDRGIFRLSFPRSFVLEGEGFEFGLSCSPLPAVRAPFARAVRAMLMSGTMQ